MGGTPKDILAFSAGGFASLTRKKLVARVSRRENIYNRTGKPSVTFCKKVAASYISLAATWRRRRDLNSRAAYTTYTLSRGASSPLEYFSTVKISDPSSAKPLVCRLLKATESFEINGDIISHNTKFNNVLTVYIW